MDKLFFRLLPFAIASVLASVGICTSNLIAVCYIVAVFSLFIVDVAGDRLTAVGVNVLFLCTAALFGGTIYVLFLGMLVTALSYIMSLVIIRTSDFGYALAAGIADFSISIMAVDVLMKRSEFGYGLFDAFSRFVDSAFSVVLENLNSLSDIEGYTAESIDYMRQLVTATGEGVKLMLPGITIVAGGVVCIIALILSRFFIKGIPVPPLSGIRAPKSAVYVFCLLYISSGLMGAEGSAAFIMANAVFVLSVFMMLCGISVVKYLTDKIKPKPFSIFVFVIFIPVCFAFNTMLTFVGMIDGIFKFRRLGNEKE